MIKIGPAQVSSKLFSLVGGAGGGAGGGESKNHSWPPLVKTLFLKVLFVYTTVKRYLRHLSINCDFYAFVCSQDIVTDNHM
jgi:hypothetical protein